MTTLQEFRKDHANLEKYDFVDKNNLIISRSSEEKFSISDLAENYKLKMKLSLEERKKNKK